MPPCSLISSTRKQHAAARLLAEAGDRAGQILDRADHDLVLGHALLLRAGSGAAPARSAASATAMDFMAVSWCDRMSLVHGFDLRRVLGVHQLALELHRRRQLFVLGRSAASRAGGSA